MTGVPSDRHSFKIGEVSRLVGVKPHVLRFWEQEFGRVRPRKLANGHRVYSNADVVLLRRIRGLLHDRGMTIAGAKRLLQQGGSAVAAVLDTTRDEAAVALDAASTELQAARREIAALSKERDGLHMGRERAREEAAYWRAAARQAELTLERMDRELRGRIEELVAWSIGVDTEAGPS